jgi:hypothetical protein
MNTVTVLLSVLGVYTAVGATFGACFVVRGAGVIDPVARHTPLRVRALWLPGSVLLWPCLLLKWKRVSGGGDSS